jgi:hypothetical protein
LAADWGACFAYAGSVGHINADSQIGEWEFGQLLLAQLIREHRSRTQGSAMVGAGRERRVSPRFTRLPWVHTGIGQPQTTEW